MTRKLRYTAHARALLVLGLPLIGSHLAQVALHVTDTIMVGWYGVEALAAVVLGSTSFFILFFLGTGFANAVMPMVAIAAGSGQDAEVRRATRMGLWLSVLFSAAIMPLMWFSDAILQALGQQPALSALAQDYLRIAGWGMAPALLVMVLKSYLAALERTQVVLWATLAGTLVNVALNWALIFGNWGAPELGIRGAAIASVATQLLTLAVLLAYAGWLPALRRYSLFQRFWRPDWQAFAQVFRLGLPIGLTSLAEGGLFQASALMMGWLGAIPLAAHGIALEITSVMFMVHVGLASAATIRIGRAEGQHDPQTLREVALTAIGLSACFGMLTVAVFLTLPGPIVSLFLDRANPSATAIIVLGTQFLAVAALFQIADAMQCMALGLLRGVRDTAVPMWLAAISYWLIGIPVSYVLAFPMGMGGVGLWLGLVVGLSVAAVLLMTRFWRGRGRPPSDAPPSTDPRPARAPLGAASSA